MVDGSDAEAYLAKARESLASAEVDFAAGRYNSCANRACYACFQAAIAALLREGIRPSKRDRQWGHAFVESQFVGQLVNRRHRFPPTLRAGLAQNRALREQADYGREPVTSIQAERSLRRARSFAHALRQGDRERP